MRHTGALDVAIVGSTPEALLCAGSISQLDIVTVKVQNRTYGRTLINRVVCLDEGHTVDGQGLTEHSQLFWRCP